MSKTATPTTRGSNSRAADVPSAPPETHQEAGLEAGIALRAQSPEAELQYLPLRGLRLDERNVRKDPPTEGEIEELADLIDAQGLLQNLTVIAYDTPRRGKGREKHRIYTHGVIAGGRRLRALLLLVKRGRIVLDYLVACGVVPVERAIAVSMAENQGQKPMSIADTVQAFANMVAAGAGIEDIAVCFGLTPLTVKRRLKLAGVSPKLFAMFRAGELNMDQLMALSLADTHAKQESAWECLPVYSRDPAALRRAILGTGVRGALVRFVGLDAYELAGGVVIRDLFSDEQSESDHIGDPALMQRLALERLQAKAEELCALEGWPWAEVAIDFGYEVQQRYHDAPTQRREPSAEQAQELAALEREQEGMDERLEALYDREPEDEGEGDGESAERAIEALEVRQQVVQARIDEIEQQLAYCEPEVAALAGALLTLDREGTLVVKRHLLRDEDYRQLRSAMGGVAGRCHALGDGDNVAGMGTGQYVDADAGLSAALCRELAAYKTEALQVTLMRKPQVALAALAHAMATVLLYDDCTARFASPTALTVSVQSCNWSLIQVTPRLKESSAHAALSTLVAGWRERLPAEPVALLPYLLEQSVETLLDLLVLCAALTANATHGSTHAKPAQTLASATGLDMADWWQASSETYLGRVSKAQIGQALAEAGEGEAGVGLAKLKKEQLVEMAGALLDGKRWLPALLRAQA
ncbi:ParB N-terminal domain-containing protein [Paucibacter sp. O1-1]|nr:ParB N-terminal domain-containing protein [Paucibacter sp. O1-1]MDA3831164.1 ParB N-terminal domain-containing protein [Paucibacter sp. O1-1]